jgi:predicted GIY-YIG superfamily endonuclease
MARNIATARHDRGWSMIFTGIVDDALDRVMTHNDASIARQVL